MEPMTPVYSSGILLLIAAVAVAVLLFLIIVLKMHAFVALVLVSFGTAIAAGVPVAECPWWPSRPSDRRWAPSRCSSASA